jgi:hypothetical protein
MAFEDAQWNAADVLAHRWMIVPEEVLEMSAVALWLVALLGVRRLASARECSPQF